jgi:hypothetical protein
MKMMFGIQDKMKGTWRKAHLSLAQCNRRDRNQSEEGEEHKTLGITSFSQDEGE